MTKPTIELNDIHWLMDILQNIDVGLVVLNRDYEIQLWNGFMESHSGLSPQQARDQNLFKLFPDIPEDWFRKKAEPVFQLKTRTFTIWEQRPYLFHFGNYRPITGRATHMYQNTSIIPLESVDKSVDHICVIIYDTTDTAIEKMDSAAATRSAATRSAATQRDPYLPPNQWNTRLTDALKQNGSTLMLLELRAERLLEDQRSDVESLIAEQLTSGDVATRLSSHHIGVLLHKKDKTQTLSLIDEMKSHLTARFGAEAGLKLVAGVAESDTGIAGPQKWQRLAAENLRQYR